MDGFYSRLMTIRSVRKIYTWILLVNNLELFPYVHILTFFFWKTREKKQDPEYLLEFALHFVVLLY